MRHLVFWQNVLSPHHAGLMASLARRADVAVTWAAAEPMIARRSAMGWDDAAVEGVETLIAPSPAKIDDLCDPSAHNRVHVHTGLLPLGYRTDPLALARARGLVWGTVLERGRQTGLRAPVSRLRYQMLAMRMAKSMAFMLAMGRIGAEWYAAQGWPADKIFPFAYFPAPLQTDLPQADERSGPHRLIFLGALVDYKSVRTLIAALPKLRARDWTLTIVGDGPLRRTLMAQAEKLKVAGRIDWRGSLPRAQALEILADHDALVLPSRTDGWGAVVNEALMLGVPVIASSTSGASDLLGEPWRGTVFAPLDADALAHRLEDEMIKGRPSAERRQRIKAWAANLHGTAPADYLMDILDHALGVCAPRPLAPWLDGARLAERPEVEPALADQASPVPAL